jgi:DNA helicase-2/ATP-dependent DNA helicase PcrA
VAKHGLNHEQVRAISSDPTEPLVIVAGPGSGKTTVLVLRMLYLIFGLGYEPSQIIATTFTRKAAAELRSRVLDWGYRLRQDASHRNQSSPDVTSWINDRCELSDATIDTLDAITQAFVTELGPRDAVAPVTIQQRAANTLMLTAGLFSTGLHNSDVLKSYFATFKGGRFPSIPEMAAATRELSDRISHDRVDIRLLAKRSDAMDEACRAVESYRKHLADRGLADFSMLGDTLLDYLRTGLLDGHLAKHRVLLVDEFQDTNHLQESIYLDMFERFGGARDLPASLTVVGDDDQSIFRFRGATVEIFTAFPNRLASRFGLAAIPEPQFLYRNYRSRRPIVAHVNQLADDPGFAPARVRDKPAIVSESDGGAPDLTDMPVLALFDDDKAALARRTARFLWDVLKGDGFPISCASGDYRIKGDDNCDFADAVILSASTRERKETRKEPRNYTAYLRQELAALPTPASLFNPRGRALHDVGEIQVLLGLLLECTDPESKVQKSIGWLDGTVGPLLDAWRMSGNQFIQSDPHPGGLAAFVTGWRQRNWGQRSRRIADWPVLELLFTLTTWIPEFVRNPEYQVYLEAVSRTVEESAPLSGFSGRIMFDPRFAEISIKHVLQYVVAPIAEGLIDVDEDLMPHVPRGWLPAMTIHQSKGLEFPIVVVDIGSGNGQEVRDFLRFPVKPGTPQLVEDLVANSTPIGNLRVARSGIERARDDLKRQYFVGYSRAQSVLLMVGHTSVIRKKPKPLPSIQVGTRYDGSRTWRFVPAATWSPDQLDAVALI